MTSLLLYVMYYIPLMVETKTEMSDVIACFSALPLIERIWF